MYLNLVRISSLLLVVAAVTGLAIFVMLHPLGLVVGSLMCLGFAGVMALRRDLWLALLPALLPIVDLASWTGAIHFTESDALVLCTVLVLSLRNVVSPTQPGGDTQSAFRLGGLAWLLVLLMAASYAVSTDWSRLPDLFRNPELFAGYATALNGPRIAKGFFWALCLLPFMQQAFNRDPASATRYLLAGLLASGALVSMAAMYERWAFVDLSNFSTDYRTTALFWEAHVGGAMIDGWLALTLPFALWLALRVRTPAAAVAALALLALLGYAVFTTFSRGLYLGIALGSGWVFAAMLWRAPRTRGEQPRLAQGLLLLVGALLLLGVAMVAVFSTGGYRGLAAMLGLVFVVYLAAPVCALSSRGAWATAVVFATLAAGSSLVAMWIIPKGVYIAYAVSFVFALVLLLQGDRIKLPLDPLPLVGGTVLWIAINAALVTYFWSEGGGLLAGGMGAAVALLPLVLASIWPRLCWRPDVGLTVHVLICLGGLLAVVLTTGTYYAAERISTVSQDLEGRKAHWALSASLPVVERERWFGVGTGHYPDRYFLSAPNEIVPGNHMLVSENGNPFLRLTGPKHMLGFGELYRVSQRMLPVLQGPFSVRMRVRSETGGRIHAELCRKHLLYDGGCTTIQQKVPAGVVWQDLEFVLPASSFTGATGKAAVAFSVANDSRAILDVDDISVIDGQGRFLIENGDFAAHSDFWFFSSDRHHLPWHAKNLWLHYYVEQGLFGLIALSALFSLAMWRGLRAALSRPGLMLPMTGGLIGFAVVGMFDSLVDAPRVATIFFLLLMTMLGARRT